VVRVADTLARLIAAVDHAIDENRVLQLIRLDLKIDKDGMITADDDNDDDGYT